MRLLHQCINPQSNVHANPQHRLEEPGWGHQSHLTELIEALFLGDLEVQGIMLYLRLTILGFRDRVVLLGTTAPCSRSVCWRRQRRAAAEAEQQRRMEEAELRRRALGEGAEDSELPGAEAPLPAPKAVPCTAQLLPADLPGELSLLTFSLSFSLSFSLLLLLSQPSVHRINDCGDSSW